jgi:hypothetical protein
LPWQERDTRLIAKLCPVDDKKKIGKERKKAIRISLSLFFFLLYCNSEKKNRKREKESNQNI